MYRWLFLFFLFSNTLFSQNISVKYNDGLNCFFQKDYVCAKSCFSDVIADHSTSISSIVEYAHYYCFLSALRLYQKDTDYLFDNFIQLFPFSNKKSEAIFFMSEYLFEKKEYKKVMNLLSQINLYQLTKENKDLAFFYLGYSCYKEKKYELAKNSFYEVIGSFDSQFRDDAVFYNANILLQELNLESALKEFKSLNNSKNYSNKVPYYIGKILFDLNQYQELVSYLDTVLDSSLVDNYMELVLLQAKSFFHLGKYDPAIAYFEDYKSLSDTLSFKQLYQMGYAYHQKGLYGFAINHLNKIPIVTNDTISQYAFYYLGDSYRKTNNKLEAMNAFKSASAFKTDSLIQHDSFFQFVLLCYEQTNPLYNTIHYLNEFIEYYPDSEHIDQVYTCLANTYLNSYNYDEAISTLEKSSFSDENMKRQYQKICFYRGVQLYNDGMYSKSIDYFNKSIGVGGDVRLLYDSYYWKAESHYNLNQFSQALSVYNKLPKYNVLYLKSLYAQAYAYLKLGEYANAIAKFKQAKENQADLHVLHDIYARIGDGYFSLMKYDLAANFYNEALKIGGLQGDYVAYKKSSSFILLENYQKAIESLKALIEQFPNSNYVDDALFDLGNVYVMTKDFDDAINTFSTIHVSFPNSLFFSDSKLKLGLVHYMKQEDQTAIQILTGLVVESSSAKVSEEALNIIKNIYNETGQANKFLELLNNVDHDYTKSELDSSTYYSAELQYMQQNYTHAISALKSYLSYYPDGLFSLEANYFLYKSHENLGELEQSLEFLSEIINDQENKYTVEGFSELARISYKLKKYISSEKYYQKLLELAPTIDMRQQAILGLLESKFQLFKYDQVISCVNEYVSEDFFSQKDDLRIQYLNGYSLYKTNQNTKALDVFNWLTVHSDGELKAESIFYSAQIAYNIGDSKKCQELIFQLIHELPSYQKWVNHALILLAKNYIVQEDMFQAQHVLMELEKKSNDPLILEQVNIMLVNNFANIQLDSLIQEK